MAYVYIANITAVSLVNIHHLINSVPLSYQLCPTLCDPMDCSMPRFPILHHLPELAQTHAHWVSDCIQPSHPLSSPSPAFNLSQHQGLSQWVSSLYQVAKVLELQHQHQSPHSVTEKNFFLLRRTFRTCSLSIFQIRHKALLTMFSLTRLSMLAIMLYIISPVLTYFITGSLYI